MVGDSNDETNFADELSINNTRLRKAFANNSSANIKISTV